jgi:hypothetical protein
MSSSQLCQTTKFNGNLVLVPAIKKNNKQKQTKVAK